MTPEQRADRVYKKMCGVPAENRWIMAGFHDWMQDEFQDMQSALDHANAEIERLKANQLFEASCTCLFDENQKLKAEIERLKTLTQPLDIMAHNQKLTAENAILREALERIDRNIDFTLTWVTTLCKKALSQSTSQK